MASASLARIVDGASFNRPRDLERARNWLVRFAETPDNYLRQRLSRRW